MCAEGRVRERLSRSGRVIHSLKVSFRVRGVGSVQEQLGVGLSGISRGGLAANSTVKK